MAAVYPALLSLLLVALTLTSYHWYGGYERATSSVSKMREEKNLTVYAMAVGQGDGNIVLCPNGRDLIIVDMGAKISVFTNGSYGKYLLKEKFKVLENQIDIHIVITHPDEDHYNHFKTAFDGDLLNRVKQIIVGGNTSNYTKTFKSWVNNTLNMPVYTINQGRECFGNSECTLTPEWIGLGRYRAMLKAAAMHQHQQHGNHHAQYRSDPWQFCGSDVDITVLGANICVPNEKRPGRCVNDGKNARSIIMKLKYKDWSLFLSGDFEGIGQQKKLIERWSHMPSIFRSTYYKVSHHGAWQLKNQANLHKLLQKIRPKRAYISHGHPITTFCNNYAHPRCEVIDNLINVGSIERIDSTDSSIVCWQDDQTGKAGNLELRSGYAIYETCPQYQYSPDRQIDQQMCHDIVITTDGRNDYTMYKDVPTNYVRVPKRSAKSSPKNTCLSGLDALKHQLSQLHP